MHFDNLEWRLVKEYVGIGIGVLNFSIFFIKVKRFCVGYWDDSNSTARKVRCYINYITVPILTVNVMDKWKNSPYLYGKKYISYGHNTLTIH